MYLRCRKSCLTDTIMVEDDLESWTTRRDRVREVDEFLFLLDLLHGIPDRIRECEDIHLGYSLFSLELHMESRLCGRSWRIFEQTKGDITILPDEIVSEDGPECDHECFRVHIPIMRRGEIDTHTDLILEDTIIATAEEIREIRDESISDGSTQIFYDLELFREDTTILHFTRDTGFYFLISEEKCLDIMVDMSHRIDGRIARSIDPEVDLVFICFREHACLEDIE